VLDRLARERQRQQLVRVAPVDRGPGQMLGNERRLEAAHQRLEAREVAFVERIGGAERKADAVQAQRIERAGALERRERRAAVGEEVLAVDLDQRERWTARDELLVVRRAKPDAGAGRGARHRATCPWRTSRPAR